ncbi:hypothetical protein [Thermohalobacter berrensis]|uniref:Uncharacterized protein n=1 Tax=Thermohalobacter berrensis TaxID=99594 RepID=A0A419TAR6_9FIRM|nr:hypothetical protein [Thermohalobacter berrensis]RKD34584.1 hypothetical protein BET03_01795 [Thermohalobacter berrensis]
MTEGGQYRILLYRDYYRVLNGPIELKRVNMEDKTEIFYGDYDEISFSYSGAPIYGGTTVTIGNDKIKRYYKITIVPSSGRILVIDDK